jgi:hypothetical protein
MNTNKQDRIIIFELSHTRTYLLVRHCSHISQQNTFGRTEGGLEFDAPPARQNATVEDSTNHSCRMMQSVRMDQ